jgi:DNA-binding HxlR family transcriptional regulator
MNVYLETLESIITKTKEHCSKNNIKEVGKQIQDNTKDYIMYLLDKNLINNSDIKLFIEKYPEIAPTILNFKLENQPIQKTQIIERVVYRESPRSSSVSSCSSGSSRSRSSC